MGQHPDTMTLDGTNTYLVGTGSQRVLIDSGEGCAGYAAALASALADASSQLGKSVTIGHLRLTHGHPDHVGGIKQVRHLTPHVQVYKLPSRTLTTPPGPTPTQPPPHLDVPGARLTVLPIPGHTDDNICAYLEEDQAIFTGDTILAVGSSVFSCYADYMASLSGSLALAPAKHYPAHGPVVKLGTTHVQAMIAHRAHRKSQIVAALTASSTHSSGLSIEELVAIIYCDVDKKLWVAAGINVFHHVKKLIREGRAVVVQPPQVELSFDLLSDANDYRAFGEGVAADVNAVTNVLHTLRVRIAS